MHTEHLQNVRLVWIASGWLVAAAVTSLALLALASLGINVATVGGLADAFWTLASVAVGFFVGGFFVGFRSLHAPILHGIGIGVASLVVWFVLNLVVLFIFVGTWTGLGPTFTAALMLTQLVFAVAGAWTGFRLALRDQPEPED